MVRGHRKGLTASLWNAAPAAPAASGEAADYSKDDLAAYMHLRSPCGHT